MLNMKCKYCGKECKNQNSLVQHEIRCKQNPNKIDLTYLSNRDYSNFNWNPSNQFIKAKQENKIFIVSDETKYKLGNSWRGKKHSTFEKEKISAGMKLAVKKYPESYSSMNVNGRVKKVDYNGILLDGNWEAIVAKYLDDNNIKWERVNSGFKYIWNNSEHLYFPDFYLPKYNIYIEVKGYQRDRDIYKWKTLNNLLILKESEIIKIKNNIFNIFDYINKLEVI